MYYSVGEGFCQTAVSVTWSKDDWKWSMHGNLLFGFYSYKPSTAGCSQDYKLRTDTNIEQHDPSRLVLCACINKYECVCYRYNDEIENWSCRMMIMAVVFAILTTPVVLLCCLPGPSYTYMKRWFSCFVRLSGDFMVEVQLQVRAMHKQTPELQWVWSLAHACVATVAALAEEMAAICWHMWYLATSG